MNVTDLYPLWGPKDFLNYAQSHPALNKQFLPAEEELLSQGFNDPIGDKAHQKTGMLIHRYHNRVLFIPTQKCPINCRYCFRKNELLVEDNVFNEEWDKTYDYLKMHPEVEEIIFTGGDPLMLSDEKIASYLFAFAELSHIKSIRFHTRTPVILPRRLTSSLKKIFESYADRFYLQIVLHTNHPLELSDEFKRSYQQFRSLNIDWISQSVLLKGVNDSVEILVDLFKQLSFLHIRPYYLHHPDQVKGAMHFYLTIEDGRKIYAQLRNLLSGWMIPHYVVDIPYGHGKNLAFNPEQITFSGQLLDRHLRPRSYLSPS